MLLYTTYINRLAGTPDKNIILEEDAARHRQEKIEVTKLGKLLSHTEASVELCEATPIHWPSRRVEGILVRTRDGPRPA